MRSINSPIELRNLTEQLKKQLSNISLTHENKEAILTPIEKLLGINGDSKEWRYLNKGTHEENDCTEFERATVASIVGYLSDLDSALA